MHHFRWLEVLLNKIGLKKISHVEKNERAIIKIILGCVIIKSEKLQKNRAQNFGGSPTVRTKKIDAKFQVSKKENESDNNPYLVLTGCYRMNLSSWTI